jgi:hypothetical protein
MEQLCYCYCWPVLVVILSAAKDPEEFIRHYRSNISSNRSSPFSTADPKINLKKMKKFKLEKNAPLTNHEKPPNHHKLTIEKPSSNTRFSQNPQQKRTISPQKKNRKTVT